MTAQKWKTVYVFVSSTFNDMHAERDYLVKQVFPELRDWCERRRLRLVDIDLRWGVTEADATRNRNVVQVCLDRIDQCRPFFLCFLGQRYGWVPNADDVGDSDRTFARFPGLREAVDEGRSVTDLEVVHAVTGPFHAEEVRREKGWDRADHAFFYLREPSYLDELPTEPACLRRIYTDSAEVNAASRAFLEERQRQLIERIRRSDRPVRTYTAEWQSNQRTPELAVPLTCPSTLPENQERWRREWNRLAGVVIGPGDVAVGQEQVARAETFNLRLTVGRLGEFSCQGSSLGEAIRRDLVAAIESDPRFKDHVEVKAESALERELDQQGQFLHAASEGFIERGEDFTPLDAYVADESRKLFVLTADAGMGKSTLLARWVDQCGERIASEPGATLHHRFVGASDGSTTVDGLLRLLLLELRDVHHKVASDIPDDPIKLRVAWPKLLAEAGAKGRTVIVVDALNQLESGLACLEWLPRALPGGVKLIVSFRRDEPAGSKLLESWRGSDDFILAEVRPFGGEQDRRRLVNVYLEQYLKALDEQHIAALIASPGARNPLYLKVVLSELRVFGAFGSLGDKIRNDFGDTPVSAFGAVLRRLESDPSYASIEPRRATTRLFGLLAHARGGLPEEALVLLLLADLGWDEERRQDVRDTVRHLLRQVRPFLARRAGRHDFFYESFLFAARERYTPGEADARPRRTAAEWHSALAALCDRWEGLEGETRAYALRNRVQHHVAADHGGEAAEALTEFGYHYARLATLGRADVAEVTRDFGLAAHAADLGPPIRCGFENWQRFHSKNEHFLRRDALGVAPEVSLLQRAFAEAETSVMGLGARDWAEQVGPESCWLRARWRPTEERRDPCLRTIDDVWSPVALRLDARRAVSAGADQAINLWDLETGACLRTLEGHRSDVTALALTADGRGTVSGSKDKTLKVWDLETGACLRTLEGHTSEVTAVVLHADGRRAVSAGAYPGYAIKVWDLETGACLRTLEGHTSEVTAVVVHADGRRAVSASQDETLKVWDLETGACLQTLEGHTGYVAAVALHTDGRRAVSASWDNTLKVWDLKTGSCLRTLEEHTGHVAAVALHADGRRAVSASWDQTLVVWNLETGSCLRTLEGHTGHVAAIALHLDGLRAVSTSNDKTLRVWNLQTGACLRTLEGHTFWVGAVALHADGRRAVSTSDDKTIKVWDLETETRTGLQALEGHTDGRSDVALHSNGRRAVSAGADNALKVWDLETGACLRTLSDETLARVMTVGPFQFRHKTWPIELVVLEDGRCAVSGSWDQSLLVWDLETGASLRILEGHAYTIALHPDGRRAVSAGDDNALEVWDLENGACLGTLVGHADQVLYVALHPDGRRAVSTSRDKTLRVWDLKTGACLGTLVGHTDPALFVALHPDGRRALSTSRDKMLRVWDLQTGACLRTLVGHADHVFCVTLHPDGRRAVSTSEDKTIKVWDLESGACLRTLVGHADRVLCVALHPDGRRAVSTSDDKTIKVWDLQTGSCLANWAADATPARCVVGQVSIVAGTDDGSVIILELMPPGRMVAEARATALSVGEPEPPKCISKPRVEQLPGTSARHHAERSPATSTRRQVSEPNGSSDASGKNSEPRTTLHSSEPPTMRDAEQPIVHAAMCVVDMGVPQVGGSPWARSAAGQPADAVSRGAFMCTDCGGTGLTRKAAVAISCCLLAVGVLCIWCTARTSVWWLVLTIPVGGINLLWLNAFVRAALSRSCRCRKCGSAMYANNNAVAHRIRRP